MLAIPEEENNALTLAQPNAVVEVINRLENFALAIRAGYIVEESRLTDIDVVVRIITELEERRKGLHNLLELESIKTSQLRYNFNEVKDVGEKEISDSILAARQLNIGRIRGLEGEVKFLDGRMEFLKDDMVRLEKENKELDRQRKASQVEYDKVVYELNKQLSHKANKQIALNEVRDMIKDTGEKIVEMEEDIIIQKEDLIHDREEAKQEKQRLVYNIETEDSTLKKQEAVNSTKRGELNIVLEDLKVAKKEMKTSKKTLDNLTHEQTMLAQQEQELYGKISREEAAIVSLRKQLDTLKQERSSAQLKFDQKELEYTRQMKLMEDKCEYEDQRISEFQVKKKNIEDTERQLKPKVKDLSEREAALTIALKAKKEELREVAERRADLDRRMILANDQIISNTTLHKATMEQLTREFELTKRMLMETREERDVAREKCDELAAEIATARDEQAKVVEDANTILKRQETVLEDLSRQRDELHASIKNCERQITALNQVIETETQELTQMRREKTVVLDDFKKQVADLEAEVAKNEEILGVERPIYEALKKEFADKTLECERLKREVVVKKAKVADFEAKLKAANDYIKYFPKFHESLEGEVAKSDRDYDTKKHQWHQEIMVVERDIVDTWKKLKQVILENDHFNKVVREVEGKIGYIEGLIAKGQVHQVNTNERIEKERLDLEDQFEKFKQAQKGVRSKDQVDLDRYMVISELTGDRLDCVSNVLDGLNGQLDGVKNFLDILSGKREETPEGKLTTIDDDEPLLQINA